MTREEAIAALQKMKPTFTAAIQNRKRGSMNEQCNFCIHSDVCIYKEHYKDAVELYEKAKNECGKYPFFVCDIRCVKYLKKVEPQEGEDKE